MYRLRKPHNLVIVLLMSLLLGSISQTTAINVGDEFTETTLDYESSLVVNKNNATVVGNATRAKFSTESRVIESHGNGEVKIAGKGQIQGFARTDSTSEQQLILMLTERLFSMRTQELANGSLVILSLQSGIGLNSQPSVYVEANWTNVVKGILQYFNNQTILDGRRFTLGMLYSQDGYVYIFGSKSVYDFPQIPKTMNKFRVEIHLNHRVFEVESSYNGNKYVVIPNYSFELELNYHSNGMLSTFSTKTTKEYADAGRYFSDNWKRVDVSFHSFSVSKITDKVQSTTSPTISSPLPFSSIALLSSIFILGMILPRRRTKQI